MRGDPAGAIWLAGTGIGAGVALAMSSKRWRGRPITNTERLLIVAVAVLLSSLAGLAMFGAITLHGAGSVACLFGCGAILGAGYGMLQYQKHQQLRRVLWPTLLMGLVMLTLLSTALREAGRLMSAAGSLLCILAAALERRVARRRQRV